MTYITKNRPLDGLMKDNVVMFFAVSFSSFIAFLYQVYVVRKLAPSDYSIFNSLVSLLAIFSIPLSSLQAIVADSISRLKVNNYFYKISYLLQKMINNLVIFSIIFFTFGFLFLTPFAKFLKFSSNVSLAILVITLISYFFLPIIQGTLQGLERFGWLGLNVIIHNFMRLIIGIILINLGFNVEGAFSAFGISTVIAVLLPIFFISNYLKEKSITENKEADYTYIKNIMKYFLPTILSLFCFSLLTNMDMVLVKHFFSSLEAGFYSIAQLIGKIVLLFSSSVSVVMFPKVSSEHEKNSDTLSILYRSLFVTAFLSFFIALVIFLAPRLVIKIIAGKFYDECVGLVYWFALAMALYSLVNLFLYYQLSIRNFHFLPLWIIFTVLEFLLIIFFHRSLINVIQILCLVSFLLLIINLLSIKYATRFNFRCST